jgi:6-phosphogluconolactonase
MNEPEIIREPDAAAVAARAAALIGELVEQAVVERGIAHLALAGGTTPARTYELLSLPRWEGVELWFGDERCVAPDDEQANYQMVTTTLLDHTPGALVHRIEGERGAEAAAAAYAELMRARIAANAAGQPVLDVALLGIGEDGHTASLFPNNPALDISNVAVVPVHNAPKPPPDRVSLSLGVLRAARRTILLVSGTGKAAALAAALAPPTAAIPSSLLARERLTVIADADALSARRVG